MPLVWATLKVHVKVDGPGLMLRRRKMGSAAMDQLAEDLRRKGLDPVTDTFTIEWPYSTEGLAKMAGVERLRGRQ